MNSNSTSPAAGRCGLVIQARTGSTRLPGKMLLEFHDGRSLFSCLAQRLRSSFPDTVTILATSRSGGDDDLVAEAHELGLQVVRGSETDVMGRFLDAATGENIQTIVRICGDNPFLNMPALADLMIRIRELPRIDYLTYRFPDGTVAMRSQVGLLAEIFRVNALIRAADLTTDPRHREHVTSYLYENPHRFNLAFLEPPEELNHPDQFRLTVDTREDFEICRELYAECLGSCGSVDDIVAIIQVLDRFPEHRQAMQRIIADNRK